MPLGTKELNSKIGRNRNASGNSTSAKSRAAAINKAENKLWFYRSLCMAGQLPRFRLSVYRLAVSLNHINNRRVRSARFCSYEIEHKG
jgi:hypothetical protein